MHVHIWTYLNKHKCGYSRWTRTHNWMPNMDDMVSSGCLKSGFIGKSGCWYSVDAHSTHSLIHFSSIFKQFFVKFLHVYLIKHVLHKIINAIYTSIYVCRYRQLARTKPAVLNSMLFHLLSIYIFKFSNIILLLRLNIVFEIKWTDILYYGWMVLVCVC